MDISVKDIAELMRTPPKNRDKKGNLIPTDKPLWSAEQFRDSLNSFIGVINVRATTPTEPISMDQATALISGRDPFSAEQYAAFTRWAMQRTGWSHSGVTFAPPPAPPLVMTDIVSPVVLPLETEAADDFAFSDETTPRRNTKLARAGGQVHAVATGHPDAVDKTHAGKWGDKVSP